MNWILNKVLIWTSVFVSRLLIKAVVFIITCCNSAAISQHINIWSCNRATLQNVSSTSSLCVFTHQDGTFLCLSWLNRICIWYLIDADKHNRIYIYIPFAPFDRAHRSQSQWLCIFQCPQRSHWRAFWCLSSGASGWAHDAALPPLCTVQSSSSLWRSITYKY